MRSSMKILVAAAAALLVAPQFAMADDIEEQLRAMDDRMAQLETQLQATQDELAASKDTVAAQQDLIEKAGLERQARSGLSAFLSQTQFSGLVAASWNWNFNNPDHTGVSMNNPVSPFLDIPAAGSIHNMGATIAGENTGSLGLTAPHHQNHNSFQLDQLWFSMMKPATAESRGGWGADLVLGSAADTRKGIAAWGSANSLAAAEPYIYAQLADGDNIHLYQAYAEYLMPIGSGVFVKAGRWQTLIGAEELRADRNMNITRGLLWSLQPENHTGLMVGGDCDSGITWALAVANSYSATMADADREKTFIGRVGYKGETFSVLVNGLYGGDAADILGPLQIPTGLPAYGGGTAEDRIGLVDLVVQVDPTENFSAWMNFDYYTLDNPDATRAYSGLRIWGVALAGRLAVTDATGVALRYEYLTLDDHPFFFAQTGVAAAPFGTSRDAFLQSVTGTIDHALTDNLSVLAELRYDWARSEMSPDHFFVSHSTTSGTGDYWTHDDQLLGLLQLMYRF